MAEKVLVSGFDRFGYLKRPNKSSEAALPAIKERYGELVETLVLPTAYDVAATQMLDVIRNISPSAVVMFGVSSFFTFRGVKLEKQAKNRRMNLFIPETNGVRTFGRIDPIGAAEYSSTLPLDKIYERLRGADLPTRLSNDAGPFVCNELMYRVQQHTADAAIPTGFIHLGGRLSDQLAADAAVLVVDELIEMSSGNSTPNS